MEEMNGAVTSGLMWRADNNEIKGPSDSECSSRALIDELLSINTSSNDATRIAVREQGGGRYGAV